MLNGFIGVKNERIWIMYFLAQGNCSGQHSAALSSTVAKLT